MNQNQPYAIAAVHARTLHVGRLIARHLTRHLTRSSGPIVYHLVTMSGHRRGSNLQLLHGLAVGQPTASRIAVLKPHGVWAIFWLDLGVSLRIGQWSVVTSSSTIGYSALDNFYVIILLLFEYISHTYAEIRANRCPALVGCVIRWPVAP